MTQSLNPIEHLGRYLSLLGGMFTRPENLRMYWRETTRQMREIGIGSLFIVLIISFFIGAVAAVQFAYQLSSGLIPKYYVGFIVRDSVLIEFAPTISCLVLAGKVGSSLASEIGGLRQKEQIDAMEVMGINTISYLIAPRIIAALVVIPILVVYAAGMGIFGGYMAALGAGVSATDYVLGVNSFFEPYNVFMMLVKATVFAFIITSVSCYMGYYAFGGTIELGKSSTQAVVMSDIFILLADYLIAAALT
jgi:phospholipid/cholesterol/gamma-HCH transport system permease protein